MVVAAVLLIHPSVIILSDTKTIRDIKKEIFISLYNLIRRSAVYKNHKSILHNLGVIA